MLTERQMEIALAANGLIDADFTGTGLPKVEALNDALKELGFEATSADERDTAWTALLADAAQVQNPEAIADAAPAMVDIMITGSAASPIEINVSGRRFTLYRGARHTVPDYVVAVLQNSDITFMEVSA